MKTVQGHIQSIGANGGRFSQTGMWRLKNKFWPKQKDPPMAKFDEKGNLISVPSALKQLYLQHYVKRLEHRKIKEDYLENYNKKVSLWQLRYERLKISQSPDWSIKDLRYSIKSQKK